MSRMLKANNTWSTGLIYSQFLATEFMRHIEDILQVIGKLPAYYKRYVDDTLIIMPNENDAGQFLQDLNQIHPSLKFTMELENNGTWEQWRATIP